MEFDKESQKPVLPKDLFKSDFTWFLYEISKHRFPQVISCLCLVGWVSLYGNSLINKIESTGDMLATFVLGFSVLLPYAWLQYSKMYPKNKTELVQQVLKSNPGLDIEKWDEIANRLNSSFYQEHFWNTPYFFYDGQQAQLAFRANVSKPYHQGKLNGITDSDKIQSARCYMQSIKEDFEFSLKDSLSEPVLNSKLPRDTYRGKFSFYLGYLLVGFVVCFFQVQSLLEIVTTFSQKSFKALIFSIYWQYLFLVFYHYRYRHLYPEMGTIQAIKFLSIITKVSPGKELDKWDQVARYMNQYLSEEENNSPSKRRFLDGKRCSNCYKTCFEPLSVGNGPSEYCELKEIVELIKPDA
ncbi:DUP family-domain-containing protein [Zygosaccharomyces rouxii]|nr:DUP family-domain-containing protein [Zygosaccharomyces rouxii]